MNELHETPTPKGDKSSTFALKDRLALFFSIAALCSTGLNFWWNNLRVVDHLEARVADVSTTWKRGRSQVLDTVVIKVAIVNTGNVPAVFLTPWYQMADTPSTELGAEGGMAINSNDFPVIVEPHDFKLADVKITVHDILLNPGRITPAPWPGVGRMTRYCVLQYRAIDSKGKRKDMVGGDFQTSISFEVPIDAAGKLLTTTDPTLDNGFPRILSDSLVHVFADVSNEVDAHPSTVIY